MMHVFRGWHIAQIWNFSQSVQLDISRANAVNEWDIELITRREISYLQATVYAFCVLYKHLTNKISKKQKET